MCPGVCIAPLNLPNFAAQREVVVGPKRHFAAARRLCRAASARPGLSIRQYARLVGDWIGGIVLDPCLFGTHSLRRTKATLFYRRTGNLRAGQLLLGHTKIESTVRYEKQSSSRRSLASPPSAMKPQPLLRVLLNPSLDN